jgi:hypothetical protein
MAGCCGRGGSGGEKGAKKELLVGCGLNYFNSLLWARWKWLGKPENSSCPKQDAFLLTDSDRLDFPSIIDVKEFPHDEIRFAIGHIDGSVYLFLCDLPQTDLAIGLKPRNLKETGATLAHMLVLKSQIRFREVLVSCPIVAVKIGQDRGWVIGSHLVAPIHNSIVDDSRTGVKYIIPKRS